jgi:hypothetical protein
MMRMKTGLVFCVPNPKAAAAPENDPSGAEMPGLFSLQCTTHCFPSLEPTLRLDCGSIVIYQINQIFVRIFMILMQRP